jgi:hypothetical protein
VEYSVLDPRGIRQSIQRFALCPRPRSLDGKVIYFIAQDRPLFTGKVAKHMQKIYPNSKIIFRNKQNWIKSDDSVLKKEVLEKADAMVYGTATGGGSGLFAVSWIIEMEKQGIPSVYMAGELYIPDVRASAEMRGLPELRVISVPLCGDDCVVRKFTEADYKKTVAGLANALTQPLTAGEKINGTTVPRQASRIVMKGTLEEVQDYFYQHNWTDGLPIIPPTEKLVGEMLKGTTHSPDEVVTSSMFPEELTMTVEKVAIVAVMAGCQPEYMPLLLALVEAWGKDNMFCQAARSDSTFNEMIIVNGPFRKQIGMNSELNALGPGNRANATIGRFLRLAIIASGGSVAGLNDLSCQGNPIKYGFCFPENEEKNPWEPFHVSSGFQAEESVVSILAGGWSHWSFSGDLDLLAKAAGNFYWQGNSVILLAPGAARVYARKGMSKKDVEKYIQEQAASQVLDITPKWFHFDVPKGANSSPKERTSLQAATERSVKVVVVGGETGQPVAQAWQFNKPVSVSIDKWK